jgi:hypothetical protein
MWNHVSDLSLVVRVEGGSGDVTGATACPAKRTGEQDLALIRCDNSLCLGDTSTK